MKKPRGGWVTKAGAIKTIVALGEVKEGDQIKFKQCPYGCRRYGCHDDPDNAWDGKVFTVEETHEGTSWWLPDEHRAQVLGRLKPHSHYFTGHNIAAWRRPKRKGG